MDQQNHPLVFSYDKEAKVCFVLAGMLEFVENAFQSRHVYHIKDACCKSKGLCCLLTVSLSFLVSLRIQNKKRSFCMDE